MMIAIELLFSNTVPNLFTELLFTSWSWIFDSKMWIQYSYKGIYQGRKKLAMLTDVDI